jgi:zinc resistance-associated protein
MGSFGSVRPGFNGQARRATIIDVGASRISNGRAEYQPRGVVHSVSTRIDLLPAIRGVIMQGALRRVLSAATAAATLLIFAFTHIAAGQGDQQPTHAELAQHWAEAAIDAQLKGMKTSLRLTADQEKDWASFESAVKDAETARFVALQKEQSSSLTPMDRLNAKAERLAESQAGLEKIVEAAKPLYLSLDETQKHTFITLGRMLVPERGRFVKEMRRVGKGTP